MDNSNSDLEKLQKIQKISQLGSSEFFGDDFEEAIDLYSKIQDRSLRGKAEIAIAMLRSVAANYKIGSLLFLQHVYPDCKLSDNEIAQLLFLERTLHEFCYCCDRLAEVTDATFSGSTPSRFYLNGIYYYASTLFLLDSLNNMNKGLTMGGTIIVVLHPLGLEKLLEPIQKILSRPLGGQWTFGEVVRRLRNKFLVHGDFSIEQLETMIRETEVRKMTNLVRFHDCTWDLFHQVILLDLRINSILSHIGEKEIEKALTNLM